MRQADPGIETTCRTNMTCDDPAPTVTISQEDLAYEAGVNRSYMSTLEKGGHLSRT